MNKHLTLFDNHNEYNTYITGNPVLPNVSYCIVLDEVHYNPFVPETRLVIKYNVTDTSTTTKLCNSISVSEFSEIEIDDIVLPSVVDTYTFDTTGEHTVKYTLIDRTTLGQNAATFFNCTNIIKAIIPNGVTSIGNGAFNGCTSLTSVTIPDSVTTINQASFLGCSSLTSIIIPNSVTSIGDGAFYQCTGLTSVTIGDSVTTIGYGAFRNCSGLTSVTIPNSVITIGESVFNNCQNLTRVTIGNGVTTIDTAAFYECSNLISVTIKSVTPPSQVGNSAFLLNASGRKIYVPSESVNAYKAASGWSYYAADIEAIPQ